MSEPIIRIGQVANLENRLASAANSVRVSQNGSGTLTSKQLNFVNTGNIVIAVTDAGDGNANIEFELTTGGGTLSNIAISSDGTFAVNANAFNFINSSSVQVTVAPGANGNANISFSGIAGGSAAAKDVFAGNGTQDTFSLSVTPVANSYTLVFVDRVYQEATDYRLNGSQLEFLSGAPPANSVVEVFTYFGTAQPAIVISDLHVGTGACTQFAMSQTCSTDRTLVYLNGVSQRPGVDFFVNGATLTLNVAPALNTNVEIRTIGISALANVNTPVTFTTDTFTGTGACTEFMMAQVGTTNSTFVFLNGISQKPITDFYVANGILTFTTPPANGVQVEARTTGNFSLVEIDQSKVESDSFVGDGACTTFTISATTSTAKAFVYIDGVSQKPYADYNVNGNKIVFLTPPDPGTVVEVRTFSEFKIVTENGTLAYHQANAALNVANAAYSQANAAYSQANAAYSSSNSAYILASNAVLRTGDTMTGQLNISSGGLLVTGNVNLDSGALFVDSIGNRVGIGTTTPNANLSVLGSGAGGGNVFIGDSFGSTISGTDGRLTIVTSDGDYKQLKLVTWASEFSLRSYSDNQSAYINYYGFAPTEGVQIYSTDIVSGGESGDNGSIIRFLTAPNASNSTVERARISNTGAFGIGTTSPNTTLHVGGTTTLQEIKERVNVMAFGMGESVTFHVLEGAVMLFTGNATANSTLNFRGNSTVSLDTFMATGQSLSTAILVTNGSTPYRISAVQIDGSSVTPKWSGGSAPTASANSVDAYAFTIIKTGSATYTVLGSKTQFA